MWKIIELIYDYSKAGKIIDHAFIEQFFDYEIDLKKLDAYLLDYEIIPSIFFSNNKKGKKKVFATYFINTKKIELYQQKINSLLDKANINITLFSDLEKSFYFNLVIVQILLHEIEHANQQRIIAHEHSIEKDILFLTNYSLEKDTEDLKKEKYTKNYLYHPMERFAEIKSVQEITNMLELIEKQVPNLLEYYYFLELKKMLMGYKRGNNRVYAPIYTYFNHYDLLPFFFNFDWANADLVLPYSFLNNAYKKEYSLVDRLYYGFSIDEGEYKQVLSLLKENDKWHLKR